MVLPVPPQVFDRGEFRSIGRRLLDDDPFGLPRQILPDQPTAVSGQAAPDHQQLTLQVSRELWQETDHLWTADRPVTEAEAQVPRGDPGDGRVRLPVEVMRDHRGLPAWESGARPERALRQPALVFEDDDSPLPHCVVLGPGQHFSSLRSIVCSCRSRARPIVRRPLQPRYDRKRQT